MSARSKEHECLGDSIPLRREKYNITEASGFASTME